MQARRAQDFFRGGSELLHGPPGVGRKGEWLLRLSLRLGRVDDGASESCIIQANDLAVQRSRRRAAVSETQTINNHHPAHASGAAHARCRGQRRRSRYEDAPCFESARRCGSARSLRQLPASCQGCENEHAGRRTSGDSSG